MVDNLTIDDWNEKLQVDRSLKNHRKEKAVENSKPGRNPSRGKRRQFAGSSENHLLGAAPDPQQGPHQRVELFLEISYVPQLLPVSSEDSPHAGIGVAALRAVEFLAKFPSMIMRRSHPSPPTFVTACSDFESIDRNAQRCVTV